MTTDGATQLNLWLDDVRDPLLHGVIGYTWVKTAEDAIALLKAGNVRFASLDHDLSVEATMGNLLPGESTGYSVVLWMEQNDVWPPDGVRVHSMNPVGKARMQRAIHRHYGRTF